ncbi:penicillin-binding protein [Longispora sp. NPDC051575]|uniref:penicillin-binding protein n=1 Tax=Longispora sp. NPDC051575 TaxID=3154943 RepID=UPI003445EA45
MKSRSKLSKALTLLMVGGIAAAVFTVVVLPAALVAGLATQVLGGEFNDLPGTLKNPPTPQSSYVYASDGKTLITSFYDQNRRDVTLDEIPQVMRDAIVSAEDNRFYEHHGVDAKGVLRALVSNVTSGGVAQGASTLTMQYIRNVLLYTADSKEGRNAATEVTTDRKIKEMSYALALEKEIDKNEILRRYLNIAYFGNGAYGVYSASQAYFSKEPKDLTIEQAALLAGLVQAPGDYDPVKNKDAAADRRNWILKKMVELKYADPAAGAAAQASPIALKLKPAPDDCLSRGEGSNGWGFFCGYFKKWWLDQPAFGATVQEREAKLQRGGYTIVTSLDPAVQKASEQAIAEQIKKDSPFALGVATVEPGTGRIRSMAVNRNYSNDASKNGKNTGGPGQGSYPNTTVPLIAGGDAAPGFQAGSTFKMFTMLAALEAGMPLNTTFDAPNKYKSKYPAAPGPATCEGKYCPSNAAPSMAGRRAMWDAFGRSVNTYFVWLEEQVGADKAVEMAKKLGITFRGDDKKIADNQEAASNWGAFTLGVATTSPLDLANAYATIAAEGTYCKPLPVNSITDAGGAVVDVAEPQCKRVFEPDVARAATDAARCTVGDKSAFGRCDGSTAGGLRNVVGRSLAGKTGSSERNETESFAGFTPGLAAAGIAGDPDSPRNAVGAAFADNVNMAVAKTLKAGAGYAPGKDFVAPDRKVAFGTEVRVPDVRGRSVDEATAELRRAGFSVTVAPNRISSEYVAGQVGDVYPTGSAPKGSTITLYVSEGPVPPVEPTPSTGTSAEPTGRPTGRPVPTPTRRRF